jgi:hypothetical protein
MSNPSSSADHPKNKVANYGNKTKVNLYEVTPFLDEKSREELGIYLPYLYIYVQDPLIAERNKALGINPVEVLWEPGLEPGPTSARLAVVDFDVDTGVLHPPAQWDENVRSFIWWDEKKQHGPFQWNPDLKRFETPEGEPLAGDYANIYQFHQVNVWAVVQNVLEVFESPDVMGRRIPWGTGGNRLILVPHAGYGRNAYYDRHSKSLQFYFYGDPSQPTYTCLSHDIIAHETGHAILDGLRPYYYDFTSLETAAFHEFIADLTGMLAALRNNLIRDDVAKKKEKLDSENAINMLAEQFGQEVYGRPALRMSENKATMETIASLDSPHDCSQVLLGAVFRILCRIVDKYKEKEKQFTTRQDFWYGTQRIIHMALQPLDFLPPVDVRFIDYARAFLRYYLLFEPVDSERRSDYEEIIRQEFHSRKFCLNAYDDHKEKKTKCELDMVSNPNPWNVFHPIEEIIKSRTSAYYFLHDNRRALKIPQNQDFQVLDINTASKYGREAARLPLQYIVQYVWTEEIPLPESRFGPLQGHTTGLLCGGTLVFDGRGNLLSWMHKNNDEKRRKDLMDHIAEQAAAGRIGLAGGASSPAAGPWTPLVVTRLRDGLMQLEITPSLRNSYSRPQDDGQEKADPWVIGGVAWTRNF